MESTKITCDDFVSEVNDKFLTRIEYMNTTKT